MQSERPKAPGLKWRKRAGGVEVPYWASADGKDTVNLSLYGRWIGDHFDGEPDLLARRCERLSIEARALRGDATPGFFDGRFGSLIDTYLTHPESSYKTLKWSSVRPYTTYAKTLKAHIGELLVDHTDGLDVQRWFKLWAGVEDLRDPAARLPKAHFILAILRATVSLGIICRRPGCVEFSAILDELEFPRPKRRQFAPTAEQIIAIRKAAHDHGAPSRALTYALQFETTLRQWDVVGQRLPLSDLRAGLVLIDGDKWIGPTWASIDENLILNTKPTKTEDTTDVDGVFDLSLCPMVMEELDLIPPEKRTGPLIINEDTGLPYTTYGFYEGWRSDFEAAGLPKKMWNRDLRAGGSTEGSKAGAGRDDRAKVAGHSPEIQGRVYDRDVLEAHRRVMKSRTSFRDKGST